MFRLALVVLAGLAGCTAPKETAVESGQVEWPSCKGEEILGPLAAPQAKRLGKQLAEQDFKAGYYRILCYGLPSGSSKPERKLFKTYGVRGYSVAGCVVSKGLVEGSDSYNATMRSLLNQKFGKDIFKESGFE